MTTTHTATVVNGALQLDEPLKLPEHSRVHVTVLPLNPDPERRKRAFEQFFKLADELKICDGEKLTRDQMHERG